MSAGVADWVPAATASATSGRLDASAKDEHEGRDQQLATGHTEDAADQTDAYANDEAHCDVNGGRWHHGGVAEGSRHLDQHHDSDAGEKNRDDTDEVLALQTLHQPRAIEGADNRASGKPDDLGKEGEDRRR